MSNPDIVHASNVPELRKTSIFENRHFQGALILVICLTIGSYIYRNLDEISNFSFDFSPGFLLSSIPVIIINYLLMAFIWHEILRSFDVSIPLRTNCKVWFLSNLGKYVPGKVTMLLVRFSTYKHKSKRIITLASFVEFFAYIAAAVLFILISFAGSQHDLLIKMKPLLTILAILSLFVVFPPVLSRLFGLALVILKKDRHRETPRTQSMILFILGDITVAFLQGCGFFLVLRAFFPIAWSDLLFISSIYVSANIVGLLTFFTPKGLGTREGILFFVLPAIVPVPVVIVSTLTIRLLSTLIELLMTGFFIAFAAKDAITEDHMS